MVALILGRLEWQMYDDRSSKRSAGRSANYRCFWELGVRCFHIDGPVVSAQMASFMAVNTHHSEGVATSGDGYCSVGCSVGKRHSVVSL